MDGDHIVADPKEIGLERKVAFLGRPESYPEGTGRIETIETHIAWVFLTDVHAYKLKKPVRHEFLDFTSLEARRRDCEEEVRLNRRLAPGVYLGVVPLVWRHEGEEEAAAAARAREEQAEEARAEKEPRAPGERPAGGRLSLGGPGEPVEWLVRMRRLPHDRMLDVLIEEERLEPEDLHRVGRLLGEFYRDAPPVPIEPAAYRERLADDLRRDLRGLLEWDGATPLDAEEVRDVARLQIRFVRDRGALLDERALEGRIVEGHGDLRPEHVFIPEDPRGAPAVIDCVEFSREFRTLDAAHDLAFLALECERLGAPWAGEAILQAYGETAGDEPAPPLLHFYKSARAILRAKLAVWHLRDHADRDHWLEKGEAYLRLAARHIEIASGSG